MKTRTIELTEWELKQLASEAAAKFLTYAGHDASGGLFEKEKADMERWRALSDKLK